MRYSEIGAVVLVACSIAAQAHSASLNRCADLKSATLTDVEITNAEPVSAGKTIAPAYPGASGIGPLPEHCRVDGMINRRKGADGVEYGIGFSVALPEPDAWNGDFMMQHRASGKPFHLFWVDAGKYDIALENSHATVAVLKKAGINVEEHESGGFHAWPNWRDYLHQFAALVSKASEAQ